MDQSLYHLFLYATIILTILTMLGTAYYLSDRKRRLAESPDRQTLSPSERISEIDSQIAAFRRRIADLEEERKKILSSGRSQ